LPPVQGKHPGVGPSFSGRGVAIANTVEIEIARAAIRRKVLNITISLLVLGLLLTFSRLRPKRPC
jgi:hypothetical protein